MQKMAEWVNEIEQDYTNIEKTIRALSDPKRLLILYLLSCGERCATELQEALSMTQPKTSYHMKLLTDAGVVAIRNEGKYTFYSLNYQKLVDFMKSFVWLTMPKPNHMCRGIFSGSGGETQEGGACE